MMTDVPSRSVTLRSMITSFRTVVAGAVRGQPAARDDASGANESL
jgi:hypothetical protein